MMRQLRRNVATREQRLDELKPKLPNGAIERMTELARREQAKPFVVTALEVLALQGEALADAKNEVDELKGRKGDQTQRLTELTDVKRRVDEKDADVVGIVAGITSARLEGISGDGVDELLASVNAKLTEVSGEMQAKLAKGDYSDVTTSGQKLEELNKAKVELGRAKELEIEMAALRSDNDIEEIDLIEAEVERLESELGEAQEEVARLETELGTNETLRACLDLALDIGTQLMSDELDSRVRIASRRPPPAPGFDDSRGRAFDDGPGFPDFDGAGDVPGSGRRTDGHEEDEGFELEEPEEDPGAGAGTGQAKVLTPQNITVDDVLELVAETKQAMSGDVYPLQLVAANVTLLVETAEAQNNDVGVAALMGFVDIYDAGKLDLEALPGELGTKMSGFKDGRVGELAQKIMKALFEDGVLAGNLVNAIQR